MDANSGYQFLSEKTARNEFENSIRDGGPSKVELTTMYFERQQLLPFFDPRTGEARKVPLDPKTLGVPIRRQK